LRWCLESAPLCLMPTASTTVEIEGESYVRAAPGFSPTKGKTHVTETAKLSNKIYEKVVDSLPSLAGKCVAITGTTSGTGYWTAIAACKKEAKAVLLLNRESIRSKLAGEEILVAGGQTTAVHKVPCDLMSFESVRAAATEVAKYAQMYGGLDVLACNAGIMSMPDDRTEDGYDVQMQVNHLSHALLLNLVLPSLEAAAASRGEARVISHSSGARFGSLGSYKWGGKNFEKSPAGSLGGNSGSMKMMSFMGPQITRYFHSKLANTCYSMALHDAFTASGSKVKSLSAEPGLATTSLIRNGWEVKTGKKTSEGMLTGMIPLMKMIGQTGPDGACSFIMASFASEATSGDIYCPSSTFVMPPLGKIYTKGMPKRTVIGGVPVKKGKEKRSVTPGWKEKCREATEAVVGALPATGKS